MADPLVVLLVEDHRADIELTKKAFATSQVPVDLRVVYDGVEAMQFLQQGGRYTDAPRPTLVLLDLNMPRKDGRDVLQEIRSDPNLDSLVVLVLTTSSAARDINESYKLGANAYLSKPVGFAEFSRLINKIITFWLITAHLPR
jgi:two-component system response regulator